MTISLWCTSIKCLSMQMFLTGASICICVGFCAYCIVVLIKKRVGKTTSVADRDKE